MKHRYNEQICIDGKKYLISEDWRGMAVDCMIFLYKDKIPMENPVECDYCGLALSNSLDSCELGLFDTDELRYILLEVK